MKAMKSITVAMFAAMALAIAGPSNGAGAANGAAHATSAHSASAHSASHGAHHAATANRAGQSQGHHRSSRYYPYYPYYPYYGYGYGYGYGNTVVENSDEADWGEQWSSLYEDNDGPYARSTLENPPGRARTWEIPDK